MRHERLTQAEEMARFEQFLLDNPEVVRLSDFEPDQGRRKVRYINRKGAERALRQHAGRSD